MPEARLAPAAETTGVAAVAKLLARVAERPGRTVEGLAGELGLSRSTAFSVVAMLDAWGLVERDATGRLYPGPAAGRLALARYGFGDLAEATEALLSALRDDTDASVSLMISNGRVAFVASRRRAPWDKGGDAELRLLDAPLASSAAGFSATLRLGLRPNASDREARSAAGCIARVAATLARALKGHGDIGEVERQG